MFDSFGFDPATFTDSELTTKMAELQSKIVWAGRFGSADLISNLQHYLQLIEMEQMARWQKLMARDALQNAHQVIESDPDLAAAHRETVAQTPGRVVPTQKPAKTIQITRIVKPSSSPSQEQDQDDV